MCVSQSCPTLCNSMDCSPPGSSIQGILQGRILEWIAIPFSSGSSLPRDRTQVTCIAGKFYTVWATKENCLQRLQAWCCWSLPRAVSDISWRLNIESWSIGEREVNLIRQEPGQDTEESWLGWRQGGCSLQPASSEGEAIAIEFLVLVYCPASLLHS